MLLALCVPALAAKALRARDKVIDFFKTLIFFVLFLIYPSTSAAIFAAFQCEELSDGSRWLRADLSVDCDSGTHSLFQYYEGMRCEGTRERAGAVVSRTGYPMLGQERWCHARGAVPYACDNARV